MKSFARSTVRLVCWLPLACLVVACSPNSYSLDTALSVSAKPGLKYGDRDPVAIKGRKPKDFPIHGIDISRHNKSVDWRRIKAAGIEFAFIKATEGRDDQDRSFAKYWAAAGRSQVQRSGYHFYYFCAPPEAQADNYIRTVPKSDRSLPPVLDVEWNPESPTCRRRPPRAEVVKVLGRWLRRIERHYGQKPVIYTTVDFHEQNLSNGELGRYDFWLRSVTAEPKYKYPGRPWVFWQYTGTGLVPGVEGQVDINVFKGSRAVWRDWLKKSLR